LGLQIGQPLPKKGTCKHYRKSKRWLRFPCCGKAFPCDICHDATSDHESMWAKRMICGFCSVEQPFNDSKPCTNCSASLCTTTTNKSHWEGGAGCRDKTKMNKKEAKKYRGLNKTKPKSTDQKKKRLKTIPQIEDVQQIQLYSTQYLLGVFCPDYLKVF